MKVLMKLAVMSAVCLLFASVPVSATEAAIYGSNTGYAGAGKHPKKGVSGLIIDSRATGLIFVCYDYTLITSDKIKGQITAIAERISESRVDKIATFGKQNVQAIDLSQVPPGDRCGPDLPDDPIGFNLGTATDCVEVTTPLSPGDIIRWTFTFKKGAKLKGPDAFFQVSGSVLPLSALRNSSAQTERILQMIEGPRPSLLPRR